MPEIRSITYFSTVHAADLPTPLAHAGTFLAQTRHTLEQAGIIVQTIRMATQPFPQGLSADATSLVETAQQISTLATQNGIDYLSLGYASAQDAAAYTDAVAPIIASTPNLFASVSIADAQNGIDLAYLQRVAHLIEQLSGITPDGMSNLFMAALANCPPFSPFFPVAYHDGGEPAFALAIQAADLAVQAFADAQFPQQAHDRLVSAINAYAAPLIPLAEKLASDYGIAFKGLDFSLAPYPTDDKSLGGALEALGTPFGGYGLTAAASIIMNAVEAADFPSVGFSGLMLPVLEDSVLGTRASQTRLTIQDLLLLSTICGTGLDCIPLAGDVGIEALYSLLLDIAALSLRLDKPLTARLMPFPDKHPGDALTFDFEYFANSRVLPTPDYVAQKGTALGNAQGRLHITPRQKHLQGQQIGD